VTAEVELEDLRGGGGESSASLVFSCATTFAPSGAQRRVVVGLVEFIGIEPNFHRPRPSPFERLLEPGPRESKKGMLV